MFLRFFPGNARGKRSDEADRQVRGLRHLPSHRLHSNKVRYYCSDKKRSWTRILRRLSVCGNLREKNLQLFGTIVFDLEVGNRGAATPEDTNHTLLSLLPVHQFAQLNTKRHFVL